MEVNFEQIDKITAILTEVQVSQATLISGQIATNDHLARLNSKVATQEGQINTLMLWKARLEGFTGAINLGWTTVLTLLSGTGLTIYYLFIRK